MKDKIVRKLDELGRIVLPQEFRHALSWDKDTKVEITKEGNQLILQAAPGSCFLCGAGDHLRYVKGRFICEHCIAEIDQMKYEVYAKK